MSLDVPISRRTFVSGATAIAAGPMLIRRDGGSLPAGLFRLGVASGDPLSDAVVIWTRLAPDPLHGGGMPDGAVTVRWEVAADERFRRVVASGARQATADLGHSVHVDVRGLRAGHVYYYRFKAGSEISPVGRTRTAPAENARPHSLRFAFASCQDFQAGYYTAYAHLAEEDLAFVAFLGDYIYEGAPNPNARRTHEGTGEPLDLTQYRNRHAQYKTDPSLQAAHATFPWIVTFDDHEIDNNWADEVPQDPASQTPEMFRARRIAAFQAYYEHMPLRRRSLPHGLDMQVYRRFRFGDLAALHVLDTRQYRSDQVETREQALDPSLTMTGPEQERWLLGGLRTAGTRWNLLANQVMWAQNDRTAGPAESFDLDNWDGYRVQRRRLLEFFRDKPVANPIVLTGDRHCTWACDLRTDFDDPSTPIVGAEITGTSITSGGNPDVAAFHRAYDPIMAESPHWRYIDNQRGYVRVDVDRSHTLSSLRLVDTVWAEQARIRTAAEFVVENGRPGIASVTAEPASAARVRSDGPIFAVSDAQDTFPLRE